MTISVGDLILDNYGREGIVWSSQNPPDKKWLALQEDTRMAGLRADAWWGVMPLASGGFVNVPESLATFVRRASMEDAAGIVALRESSYAGLVPLFPTLQKPPSDKP